jgi:predicted nucleotidyltransferase
MSPDFRIYAIVEASIQRRHDVTTDTTFPKTSIVEAVPDILTPISSILRGYPEIELAFLFGSYAGGTATAESDMDIAILCRQAPSFDRSQEIRSALCAGMKREVDLVVLNGASPILRMQVLKKGIILLDNASVYEDFFVRTTGEYDDLKRVRNGIEERILRGGIGGAHA